MWNIIKYIILDKNNNNNSLIIDWFIYPRGFNVASLPHGLHHGVERLGHNFSTACCLFAIYFTRVMFWLRNWEVSLGTVIGMEARYNDFALYLNGCMVVYIHYILGRPSPSLSCLDIPMSHVIPCCIPVQLEECYGAATVRNMGHVWLQCGR